MLVTSRSAEEYRAMFDLTGPELAAGPVLDCCAGGASLAAQTGGQVVAVDPAYAVGRQGLAERVLASLGAGEEIIDAHRDRFEWSWYGDPRRRAAMRTEAAQRFLADLEANPGRYVAGALPGLPFVARSFELVLCSHLLFTWSDRLDFGWHRAAVAELVRVARREVRVYPLVVQGTGEPVAFLDELRAELDAAGHRTHVVPVAYRFQRGAHHMLRVEV
jgi:hypothetical protein